MLTPGRLSASDQHVDGREHTEEIVPSIKAVFHALGSYSAAGSESISSGGA